MGTATKFRERRATFKRRTLSEMVFVCAAIFHGIHQTVPRDDDVTRKVGRVLEIVDGKHDSRRHGIGAEESFRQFAEGFHLDIAPLATGFAGPAEPVKLAGDVASELPPTLLAAASSKKRDICGAVLFQ